MMKANCLGNAPGDEYIKVPKIQATTDRIDHCNRSADACIGLLQLWPEMN